MKILLVEDDSLFASIVANKLRVEGFEAVCVYDGIEAVEKMCVIMPDLILLDLLLPGKDGYEVLTVLRSTRETELIPVIVVSNLGGADDIARAERLGISSYMVKASSTPNSIIEKIKEKFPHRTIDIQVDMAVDKK